MEAYLQQEKIMNMLRQPIPGKRVDLIRLQVVRESTGLYGISRFRPGIIPGDVRQYTNGAYGRGDCIGGDTQRLLSRDAGGI